MKIGICGVCGRMGQAILRVLLERGHALGAAFEAESCPQMGQDAGLLAAAGNLNIEISPISRRDAERTDGIIDFSLPAASMELIKIAREAGRPVVIGTTGFTDPQKQEILSASKHIPVLMSPNMSLGVNLLFKLTEIASGILKDDYDIEIFEAHHRFKKDAPSGTAKRLLEIIKNSSPALKNAKESHGRAGDLVPREKDEIGILSMRGGDIFGDHTVYFAGMGERLELTHRVSGRETLAKGAVTAMEFLAGKKNGMYNMFDVLRL